MVGTLWVQAPSCKTVVIICNGYRTPTDSRILFISSTNTIEEPHLGASKFRECWALLATCYKKEKFSFGYPGYSWDWRQTLHPLSDFDFGRNNIWEGGVGLFIVSGAVLFVRTLVWPRGFHLRSRPRKYQAIFEFSQDCGISMGTLVRMRGVSFALFSIDAVVGVATDGSHG